MKVYEIIRKRAVEGDVGIEIETEGRHLWHPERNNPFWRAEQDGSLRGENLEYVYKKPLPIEKVRDSMKNLNDGFKANDSRLDYSFRTSVHVHVNVGLMEYNALLAFMYTYLILERAITKYCGEERLGNRFCLRYEDAEGLSEAVNLMMTGPDGLKNIPQDRFRYAAMNVDALKKYGSLEFRSMRGTNDENIVSNWAQALINIRDYAEALGNPKEVFEAFIHHGAVKFAEQALGNVFAVFNNEQLGADLQYSFSITLDFPMNWEEAQTPKKKKDNPYNIQMNAININNLWAQVDPFAPAARAADDFVVEANPDFDEEEEHDEDEY